MPCPAKTGTTNTDKYPSLSNFSIVFYDHFGQPWWTDPININADCDAITNTLEALPNNVIKAGSVLCSHDDAATGTYLDDNDVYSAAVGAADTTRPKFVENQGEGYPIHLPANYHATVSASTGSVFPQTRKKFNLAFPANPGKLRQPEIDLYLDGSRPTVT